MDMKKIGMQPFSIMTATLALTVLAVPVSAKDLKTGSTSSSSDLSEAAAQAFGDSPAFATPSTGTQQNRKAGPAWKTIGGTVRQIKGDTYMVEDYEGNQVQVYVGNETKHLRQKKVGDTIRAEITRGGFANSIQ